MSGDDLLFDLGDEGPVVTYSGGDRNVGLAQDAWRLWTSLTNRPKVAAPRAFLKMYREYLDLGYEPDHMADIVRGAARVEPHKKDPTDTRRLINAIDRENCERAALALLRRDAPIKPWPKDTSRLSDLCSLEEVVAACGYDVADALPEDGPSLLTSDEFDCAGTIMGRLTPEALVSATDNVKAHLGHDVVAPSEVVKFQHLWSSSNVQSKRRSGRDTYHAGASESSALQNVDLSNDPEAVRLMVDGCPSTVVAEFHALMPAIYWMRVEDLAMKGMTADEAYDSLIDEMRVDARDRELPSW